MHNASQIFAAKVRLTIAGKSARDTRVAMTVQGSCHCGNVRLEVPFGPEWVGSCNCSLCKKLNWLVAYYAPDQVNVTGETQAYIWGDRMIGIHHCPRCGCTTHWDSLGEDFGRVGVNASLIDGFSPETVEIRYLDNADT